MNRLRTYRRFPIALIIVFLILSILSFTKPSIIGSEIIQSLGLPALILSVITGIRLVIENALGIFDKNFSRNHSVYKRINEWKDYANSIAEDECYGDDKYGETLTGFEIKCQVYERIIDKIVKYEKIAGYFEIVAITYFLLSVILRNSLIPISGNGVLLLSLTIMLISTYFSMLFAEHIYSAFEKNAEKELESKSDFNKTQEHEEREE